MAERSAGLPPLRRRIPWSQSESGLARRHGRLQPAARRPGRSTAMPATDPDGWYCRYCPQPSLHHPVRWCPHRLRGYRI